MCLPRANYAGHTCTWIYTALTNAVIRDQLSQMNLKLTTADPAKDACSRCAGCALRNNTGNFGGFLSINKLSQ
ncbi:hypothetical protein KCP73_23800 [Salmonella enterica subsp. enterica]|nr:hypothetical protein KCP73_23800 [Salmonella enterica subsp. enterica]